MNDGTTATTLSPVPTEEDMNKVRTIFQQGLDAIVSLSKLSEEVHSLSVTVKGLKDEIEYVRTRNRELDASLADVRAQRDQALHERDEVKHKLDETITNFNAVDAHNSTLQETIDSLQAELASLRIDHDTICTAWQQAEANKELAEAKLANIQSMAMDMFGLQSPPKPVPTANLAEPIIPTKVDVQTIPIQDYGRDPDWTYSDENAFNWNRDFDWVQGGIYRQRKVA